MWIPGAAAQTAGMALMAFMAVQTRPLPAHREEHRHEEADVGRAEGTAEVVLSPELILQLGVIPADLGSRAAAVAFLSLVAVAAGFIPARRASEIDPAHALRYE